ncbi:efflux RND transporter periplasmic adaptor subunit [Zavarzinia marina]|uniref:efflux RND transporter periplasmic adaptor subunit n=1 Tax=Zavarzinia marina TaxID=2911065 RepID=UPI002E3171DE|nr:efflux RND transporter periplasmic adaptor subunit [Zavarzinia marina]
MPMPSRVPLSIAFSAVLLAGALTLAGCDEQQAGGGGGMPGMGGPMPVGVVAIEAAPVTITSELSGRTAAYRIAEIRPQVDGIITERLFEEGAEVAAGDPLYQIDPVTYQAMVDAAEASLARAEAGVEIARLDEKRYRQLVKTNAVSRQNYDDAVAALKQAQADLAAARASLSTARINLDRARIIAPIPGRIGRSTVTQGALVTANQATALATIQQLDPIYVDVTQSSAELLRVKAEMASGRLTGVNAESAEVTLFLEDGSTYGVKGRLKFSEATVDEGTGAVTLRAVFPNPDQRLLPGMFVRAEIQLGVDPQGLLVPQQGITRTPTGQASAMVVGEGDKVEPRVVVADRAIGDKWLVTSGLKPGDRVIVDGLQKIHPGAEVTPVPAGATAQNGAPATAPAN